MLQDKQHMPSLIQKMQMVISMTNKHATLYFSSDFNMHIALNVPLGLVQTKNQSLGPLNGKKIFTLLQRAGRLFLIVVKWLVRGS
jgi:hypothetical protein